MEETCKAAVWTDIRQVKTMQVRMPECRDDGLIIKLEATSICGTDLHLYNKKPNYPTIMGHELCGRIVEMGKNAADLMRCYTGKVKIGDRICIYPWVVCGTCENCLTYGIGACGICENSFVYGIPYEELGTGGHRIRTNSIYEDPFITGGYSEYMYIFPGTFMWQVPEEMPSRVASLLDPMAVAMRSVELALREPGVFEDNLNVRSTVLVIGDGQIGTFVALICRILGVKNIIISGHRDERLALAKKISSADETVNSKRQTIEEIREVLSHYTSRNGADVVFQCTGSPMTFRQGIDLLKNVGTLVECGNIVEGKMIDFDPARDLCSKHATYIGMSVNKASSFDRAFQILLKYKKYPIEEIFTHRATLDTVNTIFTHGKDMNYMKGWIDFLMN